MKNELQLNIPKNYILFFFDDNIFKNYTQFLSEKDIDNCLYYAKKFDLNNISNKIILNVKNDADVLNNAKLKEIKNMCSLFNEKYFYFFSGDKTNGACFKFPYDFKIKVENNSEQLFYSPLSSYNSWMTSNWCRYVSGGHKSDISIGENKYLDFSHELVVFKAEHFESISKIYESKYGVITPILQHKEFFEKIFELEFKYLLSNNVYITNNSIDYIKKQLDSSIY
ncbi:hypothetical protein SAMN05443429_1149 [Cruoricaptor ignavus]|uniref:Uncharacterized protein n=1 Tax=Cruoricaptor ignavus TaxID=1118202 RepID=A0A1M6HMI8_9FLAO|nr:hypothetical protein [Cruoricaptor ignavus]QOR72978.1 hypothetical protein IMZ16_05360 [Cruoricaptor ignavus]SHJ23395.1 hypothetical protein SAMN05443429_1149 [Cruoricaptor ignavus]